MKVFPNKVCRFLCVSLLLSIEIWATGYNKVVTGGLSSGSESFSSVLASGRDTRDTDVMHSRASELHGPASGAIPEVIAPTPPMGWNSWNCFRSNVSAEKIEAIADAMVKTGMRDAGYQYVVIDDGWMTNRRDNEGHIIVDSTKFPDGIKPVADYVHALGLKFGIYSSPGRYTCQKLMGSLGHEQTDADDYAAWGVDFLKYDQCSFKQSDNESPKTFQQRCQAAYELMGECLKRTGRSIVYSTHDKCMVSASGVASLNGDLPWIKGVSNMHRTSDDIKDNWDRMLYCLETTSMLSEYAGHGYWNDPDMLEVGNTTNEKLWGKISSRKMDLNEYRTHFSMWCMVAAPLIAGNDLRSMAPEIIKILTNREVIALDQDPLGMQGQRIVVDDGGSKEVWVKKLSDNRMAVALLNKGDKPAVIQFTWKELGIKGERKLRDLWKHKNLGEFENTFKSGEIPGHGALVVLMRK